MFAYVDRAARINGAVLRHHANASIQLDGDAQACTAVYACNVPDANPFSEVAMVPKHSLSVCIVNMPTLAEGSELILTTASLPPGQLCRITTSVVPDAGGWASFEVVLLSATTTITGDDDHV